MMLVHAIATPVLQALRATVVVTSMMLMQTPDTMAVLGVILLMLGLLLVAAGLILRMREGPEPVEVRHESKGVILIGPIPIVWGMGWRGWLVALLVGIVLTLLFLFA